MEASLGKLVQQHKAIMDLLEELKAQMYGEYQAPPKSMIEYLDDFDKQLQKLDKRLHSVETGT
jgi:prefoldin subunit 5